MKATGQYVPVVYFGLESSTEFSFKRRHEIVIYLPR